MRGLYTIVDTVALDRRGIELLPFVEALLDARPAAMQLRDKDGGARRTLERLRAMRPLTARASVPLFANDRPDLARLAGCDGVHVGQEDVPAALVRQIAPGLRVGLSTHDRGQVEQAITEDPDYLAIGPIFPTASKERPSPVVGPALLAELTRAVRAARPAMPVVAIGGVTLDVAPEIGAICGCAAVIGALLPDASGPPGLYEVRDRARALHRALGGMV